MSANLFKSKHYFVIFSKQSVENLTLIIFSELDFLFESVYRKVGKSE